LNLIIRNAEIIDAPYLSDLCKELGYETSTEEIKNRWTKLVQKKNHVILVAELDVVVGFISFESYETLYFDSGLNITGLVVSTKARQKGIGKKLIDAAENYALMNGLSYLRANSGMSRIEAHQFYRKIGFDLEKDQKRFMKKLR